MTNRRPGRRILVIDDHPASAESFRELLVAFGHEVEIAGTGEEGVRMIRELRPEIVFCDWRLPGMSGDDVARAVRASPEIASTYMISLTGLGDKYTKQSALESGFDVHLVKPPETGVLRHLLDDPRPARGPGK